MRITEEVNPSSNLKEIVPLNGVEMRAYLLHEIKRYLDGEHGLFSVGRAWPSARAAVSITIGCPGMEDAHDIEFDVAVPPDPEDVRCMLTGTTPKPKDAVDDAEIKPEGTAPVKVHRGYAG
jgi:hypothetical protein